MKAAKLVKEGKTEECIGIGIYQDIGTPEKSANSDLRETEWDIDGLRHRQLTENYVTNS
jgi:hypothetical protein